MSLHVYSGAADNEPFKEWLRANLDGGSYLNVLTSKKGTLHTASCSHIHDKGFDAKINLADNPKVVSQSVDELKAYAEEHRIALSPCDWKKCPR